MTGWCVAGDHAGCTGADAEACACPCHLVGDAVDALGLAPDVWGDDPDVCTGCFVHAADHVR